MGEQPDDRGVRGLTERIARESTPVFDSMIDTEIGMKLADICDQDEWFGPLDEPPAWNIDYSLYEVDLPPLTMASMVNLVTDRLHALTTPTDVYPVVELQDLIGAGVGR